MSEKSGDFCGVPGGSRPVPLGTCERRILSFIAESLRRQNVRASFTVGLVDGEQPSRLPIAQHIVPRPGVSWQLVGPGLNASLFLPLRPSSLDLPHATGFGEEINAVAFTTRAAKPLTGSSS